MKEVFKGYFLSKGKVPIEAIKNTTPHEEPPTDGHDYVGLLRDDIIQLDFDDEESTSKILEIVKEYKLRCNVLKTSRGVHLYFKNDDFTKSQSVGIYNAIGLKCDIGLGSKVRVVPLRITTETESIKIVNGEEVKTTVKETRDREWLQEYSELDVIPAFLRPLSKTDPNLSECNSRNQTLFEYILRLQMYAFSKDEIRRTIKVINKHILYEPLPDKEIDSITRDGAFSEDLFYDKKTFLHHRFGDYMLSNSHIVKIGTQPHIYTTDHLYSSDPLEFEKQMLSKIPSLRDAQRKEVYKYIALKTRRVAEYANPKYLGLKDNILDLETMELYPYTPQFVITNKINYSYDESAYSKVMDETLDKVTCNDKQIRMLLEEMIGYTLFRKNLMQSCFILTGEGSNGKSTILNVIKKILGKENYTSLDLRELEDTFKPSEMHNKLANIGDDISAKYLESSSVFKKVVTGESFVVQKKYGQPFELESYATQIFCANELPQVHDKSDGFNRRIIIIPFNAKFTKKDIGYDPFIEDKLLSDSAIEYLLKLAVDGLRRVIENRSFTKSDAGEREKSEFMLNNDNTLDWLSETPKIENETVNDVYMAYSVWCARNGNHALKKTNLTKSIKKHCGLEPTPRYLEGKTVRVFLKG